MRQLPDAPKEPLQVKGDNKPGDSLGVTLGVPGLPSSKLLKAPPRRWLPGLLLEIQQLFLYVMQ